MFSKYIYITKASPWNDKKNISVVFFLKNIKNFKLLSSSSELTYQSIYIITCIYTIVMLIYRRITIRGEVLAILANDILVKKM